MLKQHAVRPQSPSPLENESQRQAECLLSSMVVRDVAHGAKEATYLNRMLIEQDSNSS